MDTIKGLVSIIIPIYNVENYLRECIDSALKQTYKDIELVLVDDGSPDNCPQICDEYVALDSRVRVIHQENGGLSVARNNGFEMARGEYVYFLDSDDYIAENAIKELYDKAKDSNLDVVLFDGFVVDEDGKRDEDNHYYLRKGVYNNVYEGETLFVEMISNSDYISGVQYLFIKKACLIKINLSFYEGIVHEDELFTFLLLMQCKRAGYLSKALYYRRKRRGSIMTTPATERNFTGCLCVLEEMVKYYTGNEFRAYVGNAVKKHISSFFGITYNQYRRLSKREQEKNKAKKKQLFSLMRKVGYLNNWRISLACRFELLYKVYRKVSSIKKAVYSEMRVTKMEQHAEKIYRVAKRLIPLAIKQKICSIKNIKKRAINRRIYKERTRLVFRDSTAEKRVVLFMSPEHGNLGDHAIAKAEMTFFRDYMPEIPIVEISYDHYLYDSLGIKKYITKNDVLVTNGGGYLGTLWFNDEEMVRNIIERFPDNKIIILPQTIFFEDGNEAKKQLAITKAIYSNHRRLLFCAREQNSYDFVTRNKLLARTDNCYLIPDMVTYVCESKGNVVRNGILLCIRKDKECILSDEQKSEIEAYTKRSGEDVHCTDTVLPRPVSIDERYGALESKFDEFRRAKLVITDRLHGMLFAAVTGTPCIAMNNKSGKVKGCYRMIQHLKYIEVIDSPNEILDRMAGLLKLDNCVYDNSCLLQYYDKLAELIRENGG